MGDAKRRRAQIAELKQKPKERKPRKVRLNHVTDVKVAHFKNAAARAKAPEIAAENGKINPLRNSEQVTRAVNSNAMPAALVQAVDVKVRTYDHVEVTPRPAKEPLPVVLAVGRPLSHEEWAIHVIALAQIAPNGFRQPSAKAKNWGSTSLVEEVSIRAGLIEKPAKERSQRGKAKAQANAEMKAVITLDRLLAQWPDRAREAKGNERLRNWFVAATEQLLVDDVDREWLADLAKERIKRRKVAIGDIRTAQPELEMAA
jgi:hypothetical protein